MLDIMEETRSLTLIEFLSILCIVFIIFGTFGIYANITLKTARETALQNELNNIRMSIEHYRAINGRLPEDLITLMSQEVSFKISDSKALRKKFLKPFRVDKQGNLLDPFLNIYYYNNETGWIKSNTEKYKNW